MKARATGSFSDYGREGGKQDLEVKAGDRGERVVVAASVDEEREEGNCRGRFHGEKDGGGAHELSFVEKHAEELVEREKKSRRWIEPGWPRSQRDCDRDTPRTIVACVLEGECVECSLLGQWNS